MIFSYLLVYQNPYFYLLIRELFILLKGECTVNYKKKIIFQYIKDCIFFICSDILIRELLYNIYSYYIVLYYIIYITLYYITFFDTSILLKYSNKWKTTEFVELWLQFKAKWIMVCDLVTGRRTTWSTTSTTPREILEYI